MGFVRAFKGAFRGTLGWVNSTPLRKIKKAFKNIGRDGNKAYRGD